MVRRAMNLEWIHSAKFPCLTFLVLSLIRGCLSLNSEGLALLHFRAKVKFDRYGILGNWNPNDCNPCTWRGVHCLDGKVHMLNLNGHGLEGPLAPELGSLSHLKVLDLSKNQFSGPIPRELGQLTTLEILDLRNNKLVGRIPAELGQLHSIKHLLLGKNRFEGSILVEIKNPSLQCDLQFDKISTPAVSRVGCINRKFGHCVWQSGQKQSQSSNSFHAPTKGGITRYLNLLQLFKIESALSDNHHRSSDVKLTGHPFPDLHELNGMRNDENQLHNFGRILVEESSNLAALPPNVTAIAVVDPATSLSSRSSGSFSAIPNKKLPTASSPSPASLPTNQQSLAAQKSGNSLTLILGVSVVLFLLIIVAAVFVIFRSRAAKKLSPWRTGLSGQLQKAFVTGVPKLNRDELETACEDFSNIISTNGDVTVYKGTLSSGVEIAVVSTTIGSIIEWSSRSDLIFRKKIHTLSRVNHKNFLNLIGYCEEDPPFTRMMVFEYAPNGTLSEHLHDKEVDHLDWTARMRIIMGTAYCLQHMHDLSPPIPHSHLTSKEIQLTDDYAAKIADMGFWGELVAKPKKTESEHSELPLAADMETNVHSFGVMLFEVISGKLPYTQEQGHLVPLYLKDKSCIADLIDPSLNSYNENELVVVCELIKSCTEEDERRRPSMKEVIEKLRQVIDISPDAATPRLSPLWWAELEILSAEGP